MGDFPPIMILNFSRPPWGAAEPKTAFFPTKRRRHSKGYTTTNEGQNGTSNCYIAADWTEALISQPQNEPHISRSAACHLLHSLRPEKNF